MKSCTLEISLSYSLRLPSLVTIHIFKANIDLGIIKITQTSTRSLMMKKVVKFGALAIVVIACSAHTGKGAVLKDAQAKNKLAQQSASCGCTKTEMNWNDVPVQNGLPVIQASQLASGSGAALGAATIESHGVSALAAELTETNQYNDHRCTMESCARKAAEGCESSAAFGVGTRKKTVVLEGDICYRNIKHANEQGVAAQNKKACEEAITTTTTQLQAVEAPRPCVAVTTCPPSTD
jgi:hypothetical protein